MGGSCLYICELILVRRRADNKIEANSASHADTCWLADLGHRLSVHPESGDRLWGKVGLGDGLLGEL